MPTEDDQPDDGKTIVIRSADFAARLRQVLKDFPRAPKGRGANAWLERELRGHGIEVTRESVRKWLLGVNRPHQDALKALALLLHTDLAWLSTGVTSATPAETRTARDLKGAVNYVAGIFQMNGVALTYGAGGPADFSLVINGEQHNVLCRFGRLTEDGAKIVLPSTYNHLTVLAVVPTDSDTVFRILRLPVDAIDSHGAMRGDSILVNLTLTKTGFVLGDTPVREIRWLDNLEGEKAGSPA